MNAAPRDSGRNASESIAAGLQGWLRDGVQLLRVRLELLGVEAQTCALDAIALVLGGLAAVLLLGSGLVFLAILLVVLWWDSQRVLVLSILTSVLLTLGFVAAWWVRAQWRAARGWFAGTLGELRADEERLSK